MRITPQARHAIADAVREIFGTGATVRLFGSRLDDGARGGDIDLLVELAHADPDHRHKALLLTARLQRNLGDQPIDVLVLDPQTRRQAIHEQALRTGVPL